MRLLRGSLRRLASEKADPRDVALIHIELAGIVFVQGDLKHAREHAEEALAKDPESPNAKSILASILVQRDDLGRAAELADVALKQNRLLFGPESAEVAASHFLLSGIARLGGRGKNMPEHAMEAVKIAEKLDTKNAPLSAYLRELASCYLAQRKPGSADQAIGAYSRALALDLKSAPKSWDVVLDLAGLGGAQILKNADAGESASWKEPIENLQKATARIEKQGVKAVEAGPVYRALGQALEQNGQLEESARAYVLATSIFSAAEPGPIWADEDRSGTHQACLGVLRTSPH